jgi:phosphatidylethanolamine-binding protein (PEBP) family uncharacterized protein
MLRSKTKRQRLRLERYLKRQSLRRTRKIQHGGQKFTVKYNTTFVRGQMLTKEQTVAEPSVTIPPNHYIVMYDPDAVKPDYIHWISGVLPYQGPSPPPRTGLHRYIFALCAGSPPKAPTVRSGQRAEDWMKYKVDAVYFTVVA